MWIVFIVILVYCPNTAPLQPYLWCGDIWHVTDDNDHDSTKLFPLYIQVLNIQVLLMIIRYYDCDINSSWMKFIRKTVQLWALLISFLLILFPWDNSCSGRRCGGWQKISPAMGFEFKNLICPWVTLPLSIDGTQGLLLYFVLSSNTTFALDCRKWHYSESSIQQIWGSGADCILSDSFHRMYLHP